MEHRRAASVRILCERESSGGSSQLEPGERRAHRCGDDSDQAVQRIRRAGGASVQRHGLGEVLLRMIVDAVAPAKPARSPKPFQWLKQGIFLGGMLPLVVLMYRAAIHVMTNPRDEMLNQFGLLALICL